MPEKKKLLVVTGGGDCSGLNAVIRGIVKRASLEEGWEVFGSMESFNGIQNDPPELIPLPLQAVRGIHIKGGTIIKTTNKGRPQEWFDDADPDCKGRKLVKRIKDLGFDAVINIGGDGSQSISKRLYEYGCPVIGVPKTIDNDLGGTEITFGFNTAVQCATEAIDRLITTAESHNRLMIVEVMGRDAGWIALHSAIAGGAEVCLIPEIPYDIQKVKERVERRFIDGKGYAVIVIAEGAAPTEGSVALFHDQEEDRGHARLGGVAYALSSQLKKAGVKADIRELVLGHLLRGGTPESFDRVLATSFGVCAFEQVLSGTFGVMVSYRNGQISHTSLAEAVANYKRIDTNDQLLSVARGVGITFGDGKKV